MPNIKSAEKRVRQAHKRTARNRSIKLRIKKARRVVSDALESGDLAAAKEGLKELSKIVDTATKSGTIHKNAAGRIKSRAAQVIASKA